MSSIVIFIDEKIVTASVLFQLKNDAGRSLTEIRSALENEMPIFERKIFDESYDEHAAVLRQLIKSIETLQVPHRIYELPEGETRDSCNFVDKCPITIEVLKNILDRADAELD